jgi:hypothetical protein
MRNRRSGPRVRSAAVLPAVFTRLACVVGIGFLIVGIAVVLTPAAAAGSPLSVGSSGNGTRPVTP